MRTLSAPRLTPGKGQKHAFGPLWTTTATTAVVRHPPSVSTRMLPGVFVGRHAIAEGLLTRKQLRKRSFRRLVQGVYADPGLRLDHRLRCRGVALLLPREAAIGGASAAGWHGADVAGPRDQITVVRSAEVRWRGAREVRVHRTDLDAAEIEMHDDAPVTSASRTAWDLVVLEPVGSAVAALDAMVRSRAVEQRALVRMVETGAGRWGVTRVRRAVDPRAESPPESRVRVALVRAGLHPLPQYEVSADGLLLARLDLAFPDQRVAIEYEDAYHFDGIQIARDDARLRRLLDAVVARVWTEIATR